MKQTLMKNGGMLAAFAVVTTLLISITFLGTESRIAQQEQKKLLSILTEVVPTSHYDNELYLDCVSVTDSLLATTETVIYRGTLNNELNAVAIEATAPDGYSGNIKLVVGMDANLSVLGVRVLSHQETPGLGDKIELSVSDWITSFTGKLYNPDEEARWNVKKDGGDFDQFTGATITPRAVVASVKRTLQYAQNNLDTIAGLPNKCALPQTDMSPVDAGEANDN